MGQRASVAFLRSLVACCDKRGARAGRQARAVGDTPRSPPAHVVPGGATSPVTRAARGRSGGGTAPGGQRRARLAEATTLHGTIVARLQYTSQECHSARRARALECSWCLDAQGSCRRYSSMRGATISLHAAAQHAYAAAQYGHAARHYQDAVAHHQRGHDQHAAQHMRIACAHAAQATAHAAAAATCHTAQDGHHADGWAQVREGGDVR